MDILSLLLLLPLTPVSFLKPIVAPPVREFADHPSPNIRLPELLTTVLCLVLWFCTHRTKFGYNTKLRFEKC